jgi:DAPG hydrolase PhiG domain
MAWFGTSVLPVELSHAHGFRIMSRSALPPERPYLGPLKPITTAVTNHTRLPNGQIVLTIEHQTIHGVTPAMLLWWFQNIGGEAIVDGQQFPRYLLWHPRDHIHWALASPAPGGGAGVGARFRIVEAFGGDPACHVDSTEVVEKLDEEGISLTRRILGVEVFRLEHRFGVTPEGASYRSRMAVGAQGGVLGAFFNRFVRPLVFTDRMATAWLQHNVEEVGMFEHLLPALYRQRQALGASAPVVR